MGFVINFCVEDSGTKEQHGQVYRDLWVGEAVIWLLRGCGARAESWEMNLFPRQKGRGKADRNTAVEPWRTC